MYIGECLVATVIITETPEKKKIKDSILFTTTAFLTFPYIRKRVFTDLTGTRLGQK